MRDDARCALLASLRAKVRALERSGAPPPPLATGCPAFDGLLPEGGVATGAVHELSGSAKEAFAAALAARALAQGAALLLWCEDRSRSAHRGRLYGPGLARFGIAPARLWLLACRDRREMLQALEEALAFPLPLCAVGELDVLDFTASRRLQLAAEKGGGMGLVLVERAPEPSAARLRLRIDPEPGGEPGLWRVELWRVKGGVPARLRMRWDETALAFVALPGLPPPVAAADGG